MAARPATGSRAQGHMAGVGQAMWNARKSGPRSRGAATPLEQSVGPRLGLARPRCPARPRNECRSGSRWMAKLRLVGDCRGGSWSSASSCCASTTWPTTQKSRVVRRSLPGCRLERSRPQPRALAAAQTGLGSLGGRGRDYAERSPSMILWRPWTRWGRGPARTTIFLRFCAVPIMCLLCVRYVSSDERWLCVCCVPAMCQDTWLTFPESGGPAGE